MRTLEEIESALMTVREALSHAKGTPAEVYSRIVGYYRSVRNWNKGKREEYGERKLFLAPGTAETTGTFTAVAPADTAVLMTDTAVPLPCPPERSCEQDLPEGEGRILLFVRPSCPRCPGAKDAAGRLGIPVDLVNADTDDGMEEAARRQVFSTPTAILLSRDGQELNRALDAGSISKLIAV